MDDLAILPAPASTEPYAELSRTQQGTLFRKHILSLGTLLHPQTGQALKLDEPWYDQLKANFDAKVCPIVQIPLADDKNRHSEAPDRNVGEVIGLEREGKKIYALMDVRDSDAAGKVGRTLLGSSAFLHMNYTDTTTGRKVGPTLLHNCITNRPYVTTLDDYEPVLAASDVINGEPVVMVLTPEPDEPGPAQDSGPRADRTGNGPDPRAEEPTVPLTKDELLAKLRDEHGIDVAALQAAAAQPPQDEDHTGLAGALVKALSDAGVVKLAAGEGEVSQADLVNAVVELGNTTKTQGEEIGKLRLSEAEHTVDALLDSGRLLPKARQKAIELVLSGDAEALDAFVSPADAPYVKLNNATGTPGDEGQQTQETDIDAELAALAAQHPQFFTRGDGK
jgi:hypothetical protein